MTVTDSRQNLVKKRSFTVQAPLSDLQVFIDTIPILKLYLESIYAQKKL